MSDPFREGECSALHNAIIGSGNATDIDQDTPTNEMTNTMLFRDLMNSSTSEENGEMLLEVFVRLRNAERKVSRYQPTEHHKELPGVVDDVINRALPTEIVREFLSCVEQYCGRNNVNRF